MIWLVLDRGLAVSRDIVDLNNPLENILPLIFYVVYHCSGSYKKSAAN